MTDQRLLRIGSVATTMALVFGYTMLPAAALPPKQGGTVYVSTVPAIAGVSLDIGGSVVRTGPDGSAAVSTGSLNGIAKRITLAGSSPISGETLSIARVASGVHRPRESHLTVGFDVSTSVRLQLAEGDAHVSPSSVHQLRLHSITGQIILVDPQKTHDVTLSARKARLIRGVLTAQPVTWTVDRVAVAPGVSVQTAGGRFDPFGHPTWPLQLAPIHGTVDIQTVPATPGVTFLLDGASITTTANGTASAPIGDLNNVNQRLKLADSTAEPLLVSNMRVSKLPPTHIRQRRLIVALDVRRPVILRFVDLKGSVIPTSRIENVQATSGNAEVQIVGRQIAEPAALLTQVATKAGSAWQTRRAVYSLRSVRMDGGEAVFNGRQRFSPSGGSTWTITLAVFNLAMTAHDALFGFKVGSRVQITRPDGTKYGLDLGTVDPLVARTMVRGLYGLTVDSAVVGGRTSVLVSRDDSVDLRVVTLVDFVVIALFALIILVSTVVGGQMMARRRASARHRTAE